MITTKTTSPNKPAITFKLLYAFFFLTLAWTIPAAANTFNVNTTNDTHAVDPYAGTGLDANGTVSLRSALETADAIGGAHTINLPNGTYLLTEGEIYMGSFAQDITINGAAVATTIIEMATGANQDRILFINYTGAEPDVHTSISNVTFKNGHLNSDPYGGGAIRAGGPNNSLTVTNCVFTNNTLDLVAGTTGGAINMSGGGAMSISGCTFTNNSNPVSDGGAVYYFMHNFPNLTGSVSIVNSSFSGNTATVDGSGNGGAIGIAAQGASSGQSFSVSIKENTFLNNTAPGGNGGAIFAQNSFGPTGTVDINFNRFVGNSSSSPATSGLAMNAATGSVSATNNWWGCNGGPTSGSCNRAAVVGTGGAGTLTVTPYLQLKASASPASICSGELNNTSTVTASFLSNSSGNAIAAADLDALIGQPISFVNPILGTLSAAQTTIQSNGTATVLFTSNGTPGAGSVNAAVDNVPNNDAVAKASIAVTAAATIVTQPANTNVCTGGTANFTVVASGSAPLTYQWYLGATPLSNGPSGSGSTYAGATTVTLTIANTSAADNAADYNVKVTNNCGTTTSSNVSLTVNANPVVTNPAVSTGTIGAPFSQTFTQTGGGAGTVFSTTSVLPNGLSLSAAGVLSGTPIQSGTFPITVRATTTTGCFGDGPVYNLVISNCPVITVTNPGVTTGTLGVAFSQSFTQSGGALPVTFTTASSLPPGLSLSGAGVLSGTPSQTGSYSIVVTVTDANGCTGTGSAYTLVISCPSVTVNAVSNQVVCNNTATAAVNFSGTPAGTVFNWTNNTSSIGLAASGSGNIASFIATNASGAAVTATITVTPVYTFGSSTCTGNPVTFTITVNPQLQLGACSKTDASCNGTSNGSVSAGTVTGATGSVSYTWKNASNITVGTSPTVTGLPAGTYTLTVTDNCSSQNCTVTVGQPSVLTGGTITMSPNPTVAGEQPNTIFLGYGPQTVSLTASAPAGGTAPYTTVWSTGSTASSINVSPLTTTTYTFTITDAQGCTRVTSFTITVIDYRCGNDNTKITVCHNGHTICINPNAVQAHLDHGDDLGPCPYTSRSSIQAGPADEPFTVHVFPNPASSVFIIQVKGHNAEPVTVRVTDITGKVHSFSTIPGNRSAVTVGSELRAGIYFAEVVQGKNRQVIKLVKLD